MEISFKNAENQKAWDDYKKAKIEQGTPHASLLQYKEATLQIEKSCNDKPFSTLTVESLTDARTIKNKKVCHINGFLLDCVNLKLFNLSNDVKIELIPSNYRQLVSEMFLSKGGF